LEREELRKIEEQSRQEKESNRDLFFELVRPHVKWLDHFIGHLTRYSESIGEIVRDDLTPDEVVDAALIQAYDHFLRNGFPEDVRSWLTRVSVDRLDDEINRLVSERKRTPVHIEEDIPETPPKEWVTRLGEEILYFYQPDEDLKIEDTIADPGSVDPEEQLATKETSQCVQGSLRDMPEDWRTVLLLHFGEDEPIANVAGATGKTEREVRRIIGYSRKYLGQRLVEAGCIARPGRKAA
jgi:RNA polymerase sigma factor (sigma-70 family)